MTEENNPTGGLTPEQYKMAVEYLGVGGVNAIINKTNEIVGAVFTNINENIKEKENNET